jgi:hypothetical protein
VHAVVGDAQGEIIHSTMIEFVFMTTKNHFDKVMLGEPFPRCAVGCKYGNEWGRGPFVPPKSPRYGVDSERTYIS